MARVELLNAAGREARLAALRRLASPERFEAPAFTDQVNNHVHTTYSFSPYSPTAAAWMARQAGLRAVGSVDHDSIAAAPETIEACRILGIGSTVGCEIRVNFTGTALEGRRINNPDSLNVAYIVFHGVPATAVRAVDEFLRPVRTARNERNRVQTGRMSEALIAAGESAVSFDDVIAYSMTHEGGGVTERHILYAAALSLMERRSPGAALREWVEQKLTGPLPSRTAAYLDDPTNPHYVYDLLGALKGSFLAGFFVQPDEDECLPVADAVAFANSVGSVPAYAYLGDVTDSPTGDKKAERFEDEYLDELFVELKRLEFRAVTYMPPRNTREQLRRVKDLCGRHELMEISGVDINSSRQLFTCDEILDADFRHLIDATWALIAHEKLTTLDADLSLFSERAMATSLDDRIRRYARIGRAIDPHHPERAADALANRG